MQKRLYFFRQKSDDRNMIAKARPFKANQNYSVLLCYTVGCHSCSPGQYLGPCKLQQLCLKAMTWQLTSQKTPPGDTMLLEPAAAEHRRVWQRSPVTAAIMGTTMSEPCIYDKLSESIDILRQSGYRYGMSEKEIERFIKQVLETNEPRREPPQFPILRATIKVRPVRFFHLFLSLLLYDFRNWALQTH